MKKSIGIAPTEELGSRRQFTTDVSWGDPLDIEDIQAALAARAKELGD